MATLKNLCIVLSVSLSLLLVLLSTAHSATNTNTLSFTFNKFDPGQSNLILQGDAVITESGKLQLTRVNSNGVPKSSSLGRALYAAPIQLWDDETGAVASFATSFSFVIFAPNKSNTADGIALFLGPVGSEPKTNGGFLGLFENKNYDKSLQTVAVEFDTHSNEWDPKTLHMGIDVNSIRSIKTASWGLANGQVAKVLVTYDATTSLLVASLVHPSRRTSYILSERVNLKDVLPQYVSVGFSATTGLQDAFVETHDVLSWSFASKLSLGNCSTDDALDLSSFMLHEAI